MYAIKIDEHKIVPLGLCAGSFGAIATGFVDLGVPTGGYIGLEGAFAFQHATISPSMQVAGVAATIAITAAVALVTIGFIRATVGLRVSEEDEIKGLDAAYWAPRT